MSDEKFIAYGSMKTAYPHGKDYARIERQAPYSPSEVESTLQLMTIAYVLFPHAIPEPDTAWIDPSTGKPNLTDEKIPHDQGHAVVQKWLQERYAGRSYAEYEAQAKAHLVAIGESPKFQKMQRDFQEVGLTGYECSPHNIIQHENGDMLFVDFEPAFRITKDERGNDSSVLRCDPDKLARAIQRLEGSSMGVALDAYRRLREIAPPALREKFWDL